MEKLILGIKVKNPECLKHETTNQAFKKLEKYGLTLLFTKDNTMITPNLCELLTTGVTHKNTPLLLYTAWLRHLFMKKCVEVVNVITDCPLKPVVNSFINFLYKGAGKDGFLWYSLSKTIYSPEELYMLSKITVNNINPHDFVQTIFSSKINTIQKTVKAQEKSPIIMATSDKYIILHGEKDSYSDWHIISLLKIILEKVKKGDNTPVNYLTTYPVCHPLNKVIHNFNKIIIGYDGVRGCEVNITDNSEYSLTGKMGKTRKIELASNITEDDFKKCINGDCEKFHTNNQKVNELFKILILNSYIKEELIKHKFGVMRESISLINDQIIRTLFNPTPKDIITGIFHHLNKNIMLLNKSYPFKLTLNYRLIDNKIPFFTGLEITTSSNLKIHYQVFYYSPSVVVGKDIVYYHNNKYYKKQSITYTPDNVILHTSVLDSEKKIYLTYV